jgi:cold shock CspA family protein
VVNGFDEPVGIGTVRSDAGVELGFHCTAIADGTRTIEVGARVRFTVVPGHQGRWEAADIRPAPPAT